MEYRKEVRNFGLEAAGGAPGHVDAPDGFTGDPTASSSLERGDEATAPSEGPIPFPKSEADDSDEDVPGAIPTASSLSRFAKDPYRAYSTSRRTSIFSVTDRSGPSTAAMMEEGSLDRSYPFPTRSRIQSSDAVGGAAAPAPRFIRQLSTVSISGLADAARANGIVDAGDAADASLARAADAPASELPSEWGRISSEHGSGGSK